MPTVEQRLEELSSRVWEEHPCLTDHLGEELYLWAGTCYLPVPKAARWTPTRTTSIPDALGVGVEDDDFLWDHQVRLRSLLASQARVRGRVVTGVTGSGIRDGSVHTVFGNGVVDSRTGELAPPDPEFWVSGGFRTDYDPLRPTPTYRRFMSARGLDDEQRLALESASAGMFDSTTPRSRVLVLVGETYTGKSVYARLMSLVADGMVAMDPRTGLKDVTDPRAGVTHAVLAYANSNDPSELTSREVLGQVLHAANSALVVSEPNSWVLYGDGFDREAWLSEVLATKRANPFVFQGHIPWQPDWFSEFERAMEVEMPGIVAQWVTARIECPRVLRP